VKAFLPFTVDKMSVVSFRLRLLYPLPPSKFLPVLVNTELGGSHNCLNFSGKVKMSVSRWDSNQDLSDTQPAAWASK